MNTVCIPTTYQIKISAYKIFLKEELIFSSNSSAITKSQWYLRLNTIFFTMISGYSKIMNVSSQPDKSLCICPQTFINISIHITGAYEGPNTISPISVIQQPIF